MSGWAWLGSAAQGVAIHGTVFMKAVCPNCGTFGSVELFLTDPDAREFAAMCAQLPDDLGPSVVRYIGLFRPAKRALAWPHARRLLADLLDLMNGPAIHRHGRDWPVTPALWRQAIEQMLDQRSTLRLPMRTNNYLVEILAGLADKAEAKAEDRHEADLRAGFRPASADTPQPVRAEEPADAQRLFAAQLARIEARRRKQEKTS